MATKKEKRKLARIAHVVAQVIDERRRLARERRDEEERAEARRQAEMIVAISRWEAERMGYPSVFADELLKRGHLDFEVYDMLSAAARPERVV